MRFREYCKENKNHILIIVTILISCILYKNYLTGHFAAETYPIAAGYRNYAINAYLVDGRVFSCLLLLIAEVINIPVLTLMSISSFVGIIIAAIAVYYLKNVIVKLIGKVNDFQEIVIWLLSYCTIFNFMLTEILYFPETCIMVLSILLYMISANFLINKKHIYSLCFLILGIFCYQGTIGFFVVCSFLFSIIKSKNFKEVLVDILRIAIIGIVGVILNLSFIKIIAQCLELYQNKTFSLNINSIKENIIYIFKTFFYVLKDNCGLFPNTFLIFFIDIIIIFALYIMCCEKDYKILLVLMVICVTIASSFMLFLIQRGSMFTGRVHFCIGSIVGVSLIYIYCCSNIRYEKISHRILLAIACVYCLINCFNTLELVNEHKKVNRLEKEECIKISEIIEKHESTSGYKIKNIAPIVILNQSEKGYFDTTKRRTIITYNNVRHYYAYGCIIQYYLKINLQNTGIDLKYHKKYEEYIAKENLEYGDIVCIEDTLYCPQYLF